MRSSGTTTRCRTRWCSRRSRRSVNSCAGCCIEVPVLIPTPVRDFASLHARLAPLRERLYAHPVYGALRDHADLRVFLQHHVFAVWDFMSLLKGLQRRLTCLDEVWTPVGDRDARRLVNEIVLGEESDAVGGRHVSHFEMYREAMQQAGCDTAAVDAAVAAVWAGEPIEQALRFAPEAARAFSTVTFSIVRSNDLPAIAAAFTLGREDVIPSMFTRLVQDLHAGGHGDMTTLIDYLDRHIELDGDEHGPMAARLLSVVCGDDAAAWQRAEAAAVRSLEARIALWDGVVAAVAGRPLADASRR
ncbi:MAG: DUF3050 domain-containing protein [Planctomycetes bacterium]|nr:DUF3050 domain-containing protein [Planctomycetota bacterium]